MIYVTLTTIPPRLKNIHITIESILTQSVVPDLIIVNIPLIYNNFSNDYNIPPYLNNDKILINRCNDFGPGTKLLGLYETEIYNNMSNNDIIIVIDDDRLYNNNLIQNFLFYHRQHEDKVLTVAGWDIDVITNKKINYLNKKLPRGIDFKECGFTNILGGCCGFLITKKLCPFNNKEIFNLYPTDDKYYVDDIWISGFITLNNIDIYMIPNFIKNDEIRHINDYINPLCDNQRTNKNIFCIQYFINKYNIWNNL